MSEPKDSSSTIAAKPAVKLSILLAEDEEVVRVGIAMLEQAGYNVLVAASAAEGLALLDKGAAIDAVVTDYSMPNMNGAQNGAARSRESPRIPALLISGFAHLADEAANGLPRLAKPFRQTELISRITQVMDAQVGRREASASDKA